MEMKNQATVGKWSNLPAELVMAIEENVTLYVDKVRFRSVCLSWNSIVPKVPNQQERRLPWLLQSLDGGKNPSHKGLFNLIDRRVYELHVPDSQGKIFKGSSHGWLISVEEGINMYLINPLNGTQIKLPPRTKFPDVKNYRASKLGKEYGLIDNKGKDLLFNESVHVNMQLMEKVVLSSPPSSEREEDCTVVAIYGSYARLAYCKCNDAKWTLLRGNYRESFMDLIFHKGKLHALNSKGEILIFESVSPKAKVTKIVSPQPWTSDLYLVESSDGGLLMVERHINTIEGDEGISCNTFGFTVYKHDPSNSSWFVVTSIGEDMLFLGFNSSFSISSSSCPFTEFKGNRIYFTDNMTDFHNESNNERGGDVGLFNLEDESIESLPGFKCDRNLYWPPPVWVTPSPYLLY